MAEKYPDHIHIGPDTDWDFYGADTADNRDALLALGFERLDCPNKNYWDDLLGDIFKHPTLPIEALIRTDVEIYTRAFEGISHNFFSEQLWKSSPTADPETPKAVFADRVCKIFNQLFRVHGYTPPADELFPF